MKKMKNLCKILVLLVLVTTTMTVYADTLTTVARKEFEGKMVAFKFDTVYFNVYKFGRMYKTIRFPLYEVWKIEFNSPKKEGLESSFEMESNYKKLRRGKRVKKLQLEATQRWVDSGVTMRIGQDILFEVSGQIYITKETRVFQNGELILDVNKNKAMPNQPTGSLVGRIGKRGEPFYIGNDKAPFHMSLKGNLFIGVNDFDFKDNSGKFNVTIYY
ncbi:MAG: hypothetical protein GY765_32720 [bacterium]|nr:hypothetical protein [bacterium]